MPLTTVDCITIKASDYPGYRPNFCFEKEWDTASKTEAALFAFEVGVGVVAAGAAGSATGGGGAPIAYCGATTSLATLDAWLLAGTMAEDKWPNGIDQ